MGGLQSNVNLMRAVMGSGMADRGMLLRYHIVFNRSIWYCSGGNVIAGCGMCYVLEMYALLQLFVCCCCNLYQCMVRSVKAGD